MITKKHNIDILVAADNIHILNAIPFPSIDDPRLWNVEYSLNIRPYVDDSYPIEFEGANILVGHICFEDISERDNATASLRASQGLFHQCRDESYILETLSDHSRPVSERTGSLRVKQYGKDATGIYTELFTNNVSLGRDY